MADMLSPGVYVREIDASLTTPAVSASTACFAGNFLKGPIGDYLLISDVGMLKEYYGLPNKYNFNDWYQCYNFLQYGKTLLISRAASLVGSNSPTGYYITKVGREATVVPAYNTPTDLVSSGVSGNTVDVLAQGPKNKVNVNDFVAFGDALDKTYKVLGIEEITNGFRLTLEAKKLIVEDVNNKQLSIRIAEQTLEGDWIQVEDGQKLRAGELFTFGEGATDARYRALDVIRFEDNGKHYANVKFVFLESETAENEFDVATKDLSAMIGREYKKVLIARSACAEIPTIRGKFIKPIDYEDHDHTILNASDWEDSYESLAFVSKNSKMKFFARTPGSHGNNIKIAIARYEDFGNELAVIEGIKLDRLFEYRPAKSQIAVIIFNGSTLAEKYIVSFDPKEKDFSNKSIFIENLINSKSSLVYVKFDGNEDPVMSCLGENIVHLSNGTSSVPAKADIIEAYNVFSNKEEVDVDIIIANESEPTAAANLAIERADCIAFLGCPYEASVGLKAAFAVKENIKFRNELNLDTSFAMLAANYKYQYLPELDTYRLTA